MKALKIKLVEKLKFSLTLVFDFAIKVRDAIRFLSRLQYKLNLSFVINILCLFPASIICLYQDFIFIHLATLHLTKVVEQKLENVNISEDIYHLLPISLIVHIGRSQTIAAIIWGLSSGKRFEKLREVF